MNARIGVRRLQGPLDRLFGRTLDAAEALVALSRDFFAQNIKKFHATPHRRAQFRVPSIVLQWWKFGAPGRIQISDPEIRSLVVRVRGSDRLGLRLLLRVDAVEKSGFLLIVTVFRLRCIGSCY